MKDIDIISNQVSRYIPSFKSNPNLYPLFAFRKQLLDRGYRCHFIVEDEEAEKDLSQIAFVDSRIFSSTGPRLKEKDLERLYSFRKKYDLLIWFDTRDSTGTTNFEVLPYVDKYCKKAFLRDKTLYNTQFSEQRIYTHFYCENYEINGCNEYLDSHPLSEGGEKLRLGWNIAYSDFNSSNRFSRYVYILRNRWLPNNSYEAGKNRTINLQARFTAKYDSPAITFHRRSFQQLAQQLKENNCDVKTGWIAKKDYKKELSDTQAVLSPFGWGEICFRDFEALQFGCTLIKPDCQHLETWPDLFMENETYLPLPWKPELASESLVTGLENSELMLYIAEQGQKAFKHIWSDEGIQLFCDHFCEMVEN